MKNLNIINSFDRSKSNFSGICDGLSLSAVLHQAIIEVNEVGTKAAAATVMASTGCCLSEPRAPVDFFCNRPFIFLVCDTIRRNILFVGKYVKP